MRDVGRFLLSITYDKSLYPNVAFISMNNLHENCKLYKMDIKLLFFVVAMAVMGSGDSGCEM